LAARSGVGGALLLLGQTPLGAVLAVVSAAAWPLFIVSYILSLTQTSFPAALEIHDDHLAIQGPAKRVVLVRARSGARWSSTAASSTTTCRPSRSSS
jgi:hypothetical protein